MLAEDLAWNLLGAVVLSLEHSLLIPMALVQGSKHPEPDEIPIGAYYSLPFLLPRLRVLLTHSRGFLAIPAHVYIGTTDSSTYYLHMSTYISVH